MLTVWLGRAAPRHCEPRAFVCRDVSILNKLNFERFIFSEPFWLYERNELAASVIIYCRFCTENRILLFMLSFVLLPFLSLLITFPYSIAFRLNLIYRLHNEIRVINQTWQSAKIKVNIHT